MLGEAYLELLTAYVDGELSARRSRQVQKLLRKSPEARALLRKLQGDSNELMELPPPPPAPDMTYVVMQSIAQRGVHPRQRRAPVGTIPLWRGVAAAAAVLLFAAAASYYFFQGIGGTNRNNDIAKHRPKLDPKQPDKHKTGPDSDYVKRPQKDQQKPGPEHKKTEDAVVKQPPDNKPDPEKPPVTPEKPEPGPIYTAPPMGVFNPHEAEVALPTLLKLRDLEQEKSRQTLIQELSRHDGFYIEVLCKEATHAFPRLQAILQAGGIDVTVEGQVTQRLKQPQIKTPAYAVYLDNVTAEELTKLMQSLGQEDPKADKKKPAYGQFSAVETNLIVCPMSANHRRQIIGYLGTDPRQTKVGPLGVDLTRPLSEQTADQLTGERAGTKSPGKMSEKSALAMVHGSRPQAAEVKQFLAGHKPARKGTLQVLLVLRGRP